MTGYHRNTGKSPRDKSAEVSIIWANGKPARWTYKVGQLVWDLRGWDFDIGFYRRAGESFEQRSKAA